MFNSPFSFNGRIRRTEYAISFIIYFVCISFINNQISIGIKAFTWAYFPLLWFLWAQGAKRCHDLNNSGWWQIIPFYVLWMLLQNSKYDANEYGENPRGIGNDAQNITLNPTPVQDHNLTTQVPLITDNAVSESQQLNHEGIQNIMQQLKESNSIGTTILEIQNASYSNIQDMMKQLRNINIVNQLSYKHMDTTGEITIHHDGNSMGLLQELQLTTPNIEVLKLTNRNATIKLR